METQSDRDSVDPFGGEAQPAIQFARTNLGPASERLLLDAETRASVNRRVREGREIADAVLAEVHRASKSDPTLANEFLAYFVEDVRRMGHPMISDALRRFLDTWDLSQSVLGQVWRDYDTLEFTSRMEFLSLLSMRLRWKAHDRSRKTRMNRERERVATESPDDLIARAESDADGPDVADDRARLLEVLMRLPSRDRAMIEMHLEGASIAQLMANFHLGHEAAGKALRRAIARARALLPSANREL